jgi:hypothetical protein
LNKELLAMPRHWILLIGLIATTAAANSGCRSCSSCHDYDPPVANSDCNACGCHRAGSASGGNVVEGYTSEEYAIESPGDAPAPEMPAAENAN